MNNNELQIAQQQISELSAKLREVTVEWNAQSHRYKLDIDELKLTINRLKEINDNANRYIYQIEHEKEMYQNKVVEMDGFIKQNEITISNLIIKNKEMKELNEEYKEKLNEQIQKCSDLALRPSEISLKIEFEKQKEDFENKLNDLTESKAFLRGEFESLNEKFVSVLNENNEYCEKIKELQKENDELKEREDLMKMELGSIKLQLSTKNHRHLFDKINDDPELKKYFNNQQMLLEHLETENDSMHEMYHLMFEKLRHQLKNVNNQTTDDMDEFKNEDYPHIEMETTEKVGSLQSISSSPTTGSRGIIEIV